MRELRDIRTVRGGSPVQGAAVGILMLETQFPRIPGDLGNATTFPFPVMYKVVPGASPDAVVLRGAEGLEDSFILAARELVAAGARGIVGNCGFLAQFQESLAEAAGVPVLASPLMQVPWVAQLLPRGRSVGILTISARTLSPSVLRAAGVDPATPLEGTDAGTEFSRVILGNLDSMDVGAARRDLLAAADRLMERHPELGAIVMECTNMSPFAGDIQRATGIPVATPYGFVCWFQSLLEPRRFAGIC